MEEVMWMVFGWLLVLVNALIGNWFIAGCLALTMVATSALD
jgi:hypothetical protein